MMTSLRLGDGDHDRAAWRGVSFSFTHNIGFLTGLGCDEFMGNYWVFCVFVLWEFSCTIRAVKGVLHGWTYHTK